MAPKEIEDQIELEQTRLKAKIKALKKQKEVFEEYLENTPEEVRGKIMDTPPESEKSKIENEIQQLEEQLEGLKTPTKTEATYFNRGLGDYQRGFVKETFSRKSSPSEQAIEDYLNTGHVVILEELNPMINSRIDSALELIKDQIVDDIALANDDDLTQVDHRLSEAVKNLREIRELIRIEEE